MEERAKESQFNRSFNMDIWFKNQIELINFPIIVPKWNLSSVLTKGEAKAENCKSEATVETAETVVFSLSVMRLLKINDHVAKQTVLQFRLDVINTQAEQAGSR